MSLLSKATSGKKHQPQMWVIYGTEGVGKSTFASKFNSPLFLDFENGSIALDVSRLTKNEIKSIDDVYAILDDLTTGKSNYKTLVLDSVTSIQPYIYAKVAGEGSMGYIEDIDYSKQHKKAVEEVTRLVKKLQTLKESGIEVVVLGHSKVKPFNDPSTDKAYDRFIIDSLYEGFAEVFKKYADNVGFCKYQLELTKEGKHKNKYDSTGKRIIQWEYRPNADCKNRLSLPFETELDYEILMAHINQDKEMSIQELKTSIHALLAKADDQVKQSASKALEKAGDDKEQLLRVKKKLLDIVTVG